MQWSCGYHGRKVRLFVAFVSCLLVWCGKLLEFACRETTVIICTSGTDVSIYEMNPAGLVQLASSPAPDAGFDLGTLQFLKVQWTIHFSHALSLFISC